MPTYSEKDESNARRVVQALLDEKTQDLELDQDLAISDLEADASEFSADLDLLKSIDSDVPAMRLADNALIPMSLSFLSMQSRMWPIPWPLRGDGFLAWRAHPMYRDWLYYGMQSLRDDIKQDTKIKLIDREEAHKTFLVRATAFLATRIATVSAFRDGAPGIRQAGYSLLRLRQRVRGIEVITPGCLFTISTNSAGLRVFWSGAYYVSRNYFGHPTTPISSVLQSGTYVFGVDGGAYGNTIQWDVNCIVTLPGVPYAHLNY